MPYSLFLITVDIQTCMYRHMDKVVYWCSCSHYICRERCWAPTSYISCTCIRKSHDLQVQGHDQCHCPCLLLFGQIKIFLKLQALMEAFCNYEKNLQFTCDTSNWFSIKHSKVELWCCSCEVLYNNLHVLYVILIAFIVAIYVRQSSSSKEYTRSLKLVWIGVCPHNFSTQCF